MAEDTSVSPQQIKQIAQRALRIERYILEKAWGLCFTIIALEIVVATFLPVFIQIIGLSADYGILARVIVNTAVSVIGVVVSSWIFKKAYNTMLVRREVTGSIWARQRRRKLAAAVWVANYVSVIAVIVLLRAHAAAVVFGFLAATALPFFFALKGSFPERVPRKGIAVFLAYLLGALGSLAASLFNAKALPYLTIWSIVAVVLFAVSAYTYKQKPPAMEDAP
jgi:hypothetical protein